MTSWSDLVSTGVARRGEPLARRTSYKLGGPARLFVAVARIGVLWDVADALAGEPMPVLVVGRGSNLLVADEGFDGVVVSLDVGAFGEIEVTDGIVAAGGSAPLPRLARTASSQGRGGLEWCVGVPGSVGGAVRQNAGCFGSEVVERLVDADVVSLADRVQRTVAVADLDLGYRHSNVATTDVVVAARFTTTPIDPSDAAEEMRRVTRWRRDHQPGGTLNAGSVFKNPPGEAAGAVIDRLGLKGFEVGAVRVSERHANFIEAGAGASAADVHRLVVEVRERVQAATGIVLEPEIQFVGFPS